VDLSIELNRTLHVRGDLVGRNSVGSGGAGSIIAGTGGDQRAN
jgi:hypothetical protein